MFDLLVLGSGIAGLSGAVHAARAGQSVLVLTKGELAHSATRYAQGGIAAVLTSDGDSPELHLSDTLAAGAGLCDADAARVLVTEGPERVRELMAMGAEFDHAGRGGGDGLAFAREGGHSVARVVHAGGDATGAEIERALVAAVRATAAEVRERWLVLDLIVERGRAAGVTALAPDGTVHEVRATHTLLATGGAGQCFAVTTNPPLSTGDGIAMALRAGVAVADVEFMQFHPTALHHPSMPRPLLSEALRGEGAVLRDEHGVAFMAAEHPLGDLAPRDIVARAIARRLNDTGVDHLWLDATSIHGFEQRFPTIWRACRKIGFDPHKDWLPVAPAAHYLSGGVCTDLDGASTLAGLWACGETACSGVHGANRLASNSLLDGLVFARRAIDAIGRGKDGPDESGALRGVRGFSPTTSTPASGAGDEPMTREALQRLMTRNAGVLRDAASLERAATGLRDMGGAADPEVRNLVAVSSALVSAALARMESRGTHTRLDYPEPSSALLGRFVFSDDDPHPALVPLPFFQGRQLHQQSGGRAG
ncbi:MAG: L-aspartate oxidase [Actinomycetota bacterium]|nr:L-aspartate oxidase [Actinomycetota bacterium]